MADLSVPEIKRLLQQRCPDLLHELVPNMRREGSVFSAPNPTRLGDKHGSFKIWPNGAWCEYDEGEIGKGDLLGLVAYVNGYAPKSKDGLKFAVDWAKDKLGLKHVDGRTLGRLKREASKESEQRRLREERDEARKAFRNKMRAKDILLASQPFDAQADNLVTRYLAERGIDMGAIVDLTPSIIRFNTRLVHWTSREIYPAMVAAVVNPNIGFTGVHCTFLAPPDEDGLARPVKADVTPAKMMLGTIKGSIVPLTLGPDRLMVSEALARGRRSPVLLCEGIETGLSIAMGIEGQMRVWACLSLSHMAHAPVDLDCVSGVIVAIENDSKLEAVRQREGVLDRLEASGKPVSTMRPHIGVDHNDLLQAGE